MKITLYVQCNDYGDIDVDTLQEHQERMETDFNDMFDNEGISGEDFETFLSENYFLWEVFKMNAEEKAKAVQDFKAEYIADYDSLNDWVEFEKEIEG